MLSVKLKMFSIKTFVDHSGKEVFMLKINIHIWQFLTEEYIHKNRDNLSKWYIWFKIIYRYVTGYAWAEFGQCRPKYNSFWWPIA